MNNEKINEIGQMLEVNPSDIKKNSFIHNINPWYWIGQLVVLITSFWFSLAMRNVKQSVAYPFAHGIATIFYSPLPLSAHAVNGYFSLGHKERFGLSRKFRILTFCTVLFLSVCSYVVFYLALPVSYPTNAAYGVFDRKGHR